MSRIFPDPNANQIRQALEQGLRGIHKACSFTAEMFVEAQPLVLKAINFLCSKSVSVKTPTAKIATFVASAPVVQVTNDALKTASFVAAASIASVATALKTAALTALAETFYLDTPNAVAISSISQTNPVVVTTGLAHGYSDGDQVYLSGILGPVQLNGRVFIVANSTTFTFELQGEDGTLYAAYISGGTAQKLL